MATTPITPESAVHLLKHLIEDEKKNLGMFQRMGMDTFVQQGWVEKIVQMLADKGFVLSADESNNYARLCLERQVVFRDLSK
jgi:hypothetical protein